MVNTRFHKQMRVLMSLSFIFSVLMNGALPTATYVQAKIPSSSATSGELYPAPAGVLTLEQESNAALEETSPQTRTLTVDVDMPSPPYVNLQVDLTSDADAEHLPTIRAEIERRGWIAAFYVTPSFAAQHPDIIRSLWSGGHELGILLDNTLLEQSVEEQTRRLGEILAAVRQAGELPEDVPLHARLAEYVMPYNDVVNTVQALQASGVASLSGVFPVGEGFSCQYCVENHRLMYPLPANDALDVVLIPVAVAPTEALSLAETALLPLDDARFVMPTVEGPDSVSRSPVAGAADVFAVALAKYDEFVAPAATLEEQATERTVTGEEPEPTYVHDKYLTLIVHPSITGADTEALAAFAGFLDHVAEGSGTPVSNQQILAITAQTMAAGYIGSLTIVKGQDQACPSEQVKLTVNWTALLYCPTYYFRVYGKYPSESTWKLLYQGSHYVRTGSYSFNTTAIVPDPPTKDDDFYTFMVVGQSCSSGHTGCGYPTVESHERDATTSVQLSKDCLDLEVKDREIYVSTPAKRGDDVRVTAWIFNNGKQEAKNVKVRIQDLSYGQPNSEKIQTIASIPPGGKAKVEVPMTVWNVNIHQYIVTADPDNEIEEADEKNNRGETHTITGQITDQDNKPLKHIKVEYVRGGTAYYADFTDDDGKYTINTNLDVIQHNVNGVIRARLEYSPDDLTNKIKFKFYDDAKWDAGHTDTYYKDTGAWSIRRDQNYTGKDIQFTWQQGGRTYSTIVQAFEYFKNLAATSFTAPAMTFEFMDDDYADQTSYQQGDTIHMWNTHTDDRCIHAHEFAHRVSNAWGIPYNPIDENWANYATSLSRNTSKHDSSICVADIAVDANTDANDGWFWQLTGVYWDLTRDLVIATLKNDSPQTVKQFYDKYRIRDATRTMTETRQIFRNHGYNVTGWTLQAESAPLESQSGSAAFNDVYAYTTHDADGDSRWDSLTISVGLNITTPGDYEALGFLGDGSGKSCFARYAGTFAAGSQVAPLSFDGLCIYQKALSGTLTLVDLALQKVDAEELDYRSTAYTLPRSYAYTDFQKPIVTPSGVYAEQGVDTDGDGEYNTLSVQVGLDVAEAVTVALSADLYVGSGTPIATSRAGDVLLTPGTYTLTLDFDGRDLYAYGYDGTYTLRALTIVSDEPCACHAKIPSEHIIFASDPLDALYTTQAYSYTEFESPDAYLVGPVTDYGSDTDGDGQYNVLSVEATLDAADGSNYTVLGSLARDGVIVAYASASITTTGVQSVSLHFDGMDIRRARLDGPYTLTLRLRDDDRACLEGGLCQTGVIALVTTTAAYNYTQFQLPPEDYVDIAYSDRGSDTDGDGFYNYLTVDMLITATQAMTYAFAGKLTDAAGQPVAYAWASAAMGTTPQTVALNFPGGDVWRTLNPSERYTLTVDIEAPPGQQLLTLPDAYTTGIYAYTQFDPPAAHLAAGYTDQGTDVDGDNLYDYLDVNVNVQVAISNTYRLVGNLTDSAGLFLAHAVVASNLVTGSHTVRLRFDGMTIHASGLDGPYVLHDLALYADDNALLDDQAAPYTTTAYTTAQFQPGSALAGTINGPEGPVAQTLVVVEGPTYRSDRADDSGAYYIDSLHSGLYTVTVTPLPELGLLGSTQVVNVAAGETTVANFTLAAGSVISGVVRDQRGQPVSDADVLALGPRNVSVKTDADGRYRLTHLPNGYYYLYAVPPASTFLKEGSSSINIYTSGTYVIDFTLSGVGGIYGRVTDANGNPLQAEIDLGGYEPPHYPTDADGYYYIAGLNPGTYNVHITTDPAYADWWMYADGRHADNGAQVSAQVVIGRATRVDFRRPPATPVADLYVDKSLQTGVVGFGEEITYRVRVRNLGNLGVTNIVVTDTLPPEAAYVAESHPAGFSLLNTGQQTVWSKGALPAYGQSGYEASLDLTARLTDTLIAGDVITNMLNASSGVSEGDINNNTYLYAQTAITPTRDLQVDKWRNSGISLPGGDIQYTLYIYNSGNSAAPNVRITDTLPISTTYVIQQNYYDFTPHVEGNQVVWTKDFFASGAYAYLYLTIHISDTVSPGTILTNTVEAGTSRPETNYANNIDSYSETVQERTRDMIVAKYKESGKELAGANFTYRIYVNNQGNTAAANVVLTDTLPYSATYVSSYNTTYFPNYAYDLFAPHVAGNVITWSLGTVPAGGYGNFYVATRISDTVTPGDVLTNTAQVATTDVENNTINNRADYPITIISPTYDMYAYKSFYTGSPSPGSDMTYQIYYQNYGNSPCQNVIITDTLPPEVSYVSWSGPFTPTVNGQRVIWNLGAVPGQYDSGYYGYLYLTVRIPETMTVGTVLTNTAVITTTTPESGGQSNSSASVQTVVAPTPNLYLSKSLYYSQLVQGSEVTYRLTYQNYNNSAALDTVLTDTLPPGVSFVSASPFTPTVQGNKVVWNIGRVPGYGYSGASGQINLRAYISDAVTAGSVLTNTAVITTPYDTDPANNTSLHSGTVISGTRDLYLSKGHQTGYFVSGNDVTYYLYYVNQGNASAQNVVITDTLPAEMSYVSHSGAFTPTIQGNKVVWRLGTVPGQYYGSYYGYLYLTVRLSTALQPGDSVTNTAVIATSQVESNYVNNNAAHSAVIVAPTRDMSVYKSLSSGEVMPGSVITYQLSVNNYGNATASGVRLTDTLPLSMTYVRSSSRTYFPNLTYDAFPPTVNGRIVTWDLNAVPAGGYGYFYLAARIDDGVAAGDILTNTAVISTSDPDTYLWNNTATRTDITWTPDAYEPDDFYSQARSITKNGAPQSHNFHRQGDTDWVTFRGILGKEYVIETSNLGTNAHPYLYLYASDGSTLIASDYGSGGGYASRIVWVATQSDNYYVRVGDYWSSYGFNATYDLVVYEYDPAPDLTVDKTHSGVMRGGEVVTYTITYANQGTALAGNVVLTDTLPPAAVYSSDDGGGVPDASGQIVVWNLGTLASDAEGVINVHVHVSETLRAGALVTNVVEIATSTPERRYDNNSVHYGTVALTPWGGPDAFGYTFKASNRPNGPLYEWMDISATGSEVWPAQGRDDSYAGPFDIGFGFPFYGTPYTQLYVGSNGYVSFGQGYSSIPGSTLPSTNYPNNVIMPFGGDMVHTADVSHIYYQQLSNPTRFVVQYNTLDRYSPRGHFVTFQIVLYPDGTILTPYNNVELSYPPTVVGIENITGTVGLDYGTSVFGGLAVKYYPPSLTPTPQRIEIDAHPRRIAVGGETAVITATVYDQYNALVPDGTGVAFSSNLGSIPANATTVDGVATAILTSGSTPGLATVVAQAGEVSAEVQVEFVAQTGTIIGPPGGVITSTRGDVTIVFPSGVLTGTTYITLTDYYAIENVPGGFGFAGHAFGLIAVDAAGDPVALQAPITVTIRYSDTDMVGMDEEALRLTYWTGSAWKDALCVGHAYDRHLDENWLAAPICHLTDFALLGPWIAVSTASIAGPTTGAKNVSYTFTATSGPLTATTPITYAWQATHQTSVVHPGRGFTDTVSFTWAVAGTQWITVTVSNAGGGILATYSITIAEESEDHYIYLPLVMRARVAP